MIAMKHFTSCVIFLPGSSISQRSGGATATGCSQAPALSGFKKWESLLMLCVCLCVCVCVRHVCGNRCASFVHYTPLCTRVDKWVTDVSVETDSKWWKMCLQQFSELFSWEQGPFSALEVIALSIKKKQKKKNLLKVELQANAVWVHRARPEFMVSEAALSCISACHHRLESQIFSCIQFSWPYFSRQKLLHKVKAKRSQSSI